MVLCTFRLLANLITSITSSKFFIFIFLRFVSCLTFVCNPNFPQGFLVSGSGDSTVSEVLFLFLVMNLDCYFQFILNLISDFLQVCLWDVTSGSLLCTSEVGREVGQCAREIIFCLHFCTTPTFNHHIN